LEAAKAKIESLSEKFPRFSGMTLANAAKIVCSKEAYNIISTSKFKDATLKDLKEGWNSPDTVESYRNEILSSELGSMTINQIFNANEAMKTFNVGKMMGLEEVGDISLSELEKTVC
jgi:hypothetical protein